MRPVASMAEYVKRASLKELSSSSLTNKDAAKIVADDFVSVITQLRRGIAIAQDAGDESTADMLIGSITRYEKDLWMLRTFLV